MIIKTAEFFSAYGTNKQLPVSEKADGTKARLVNQRAWLRAKDGTYTVARIDQDGGNYMILPLVCNTTEGPKTHGTYIWGEFEDLQKTYDRDLKKDVMTA